MSIQGWNPPPFVLINRMVIHIDTFTETLYSCIFGPILYSPKQDIESMLVVDTLFHRSPLVFPLFTFAWFCKRLSSSMCFLLISLIRLFQDRLSFKISFTTPNSFPRIVCTFIRSSISQWLDNSMCILVAHGEENHLIRSTNLVIRDCSLSSILIHLRWYHLWQKPSQNSPYPSLVINSLQILHGASESSFNSRWDMQ